MKVVSVGLVMALMLSTAIASAQRPRPGRNFEDRFQQRRNQSRRGEIAEQGKMAPDFHLKSLDGKSDVKLSSFVGQKPVALFFGSYT